MVGGPSISLGLDQWQQARAWPYGRLSEYHTLHGVSIDGMLNVPLHAQLYMGPGTCERVSWISVWSECPRHLDRPCLQEGILMQESNAGCSTRPCHPWPWLGQCLPPLAPPLCNSQTHWLTCSKRGISVAWNPYKDCVWCQARRGWSASQNAHDCCTGTLYLEAAHSSHPIVCCRRSRDTVLAPSWCAASDYLTRGDMW